MLYGWFRFQVNWFAIGAAFLCALAAYTKAYAAVLRSVNDRKRLTSTLIWFLHLLIGYGFYISIIKIAELLFYDQFGFWHSFNNPGFWSRFIGFVIMGIAVFGAIFLSKALIPAIGFFGGGATALSTSLTDTPPSPPKKDFTEQRSRNDKATIHGSAEFSDFNNFNQKYNGLSNAEMYKQFEEQGGYVISPNFAKYIPHTHAITVAGAGQGKGTTTIIPNLLTRPKDNWIILDVKGENAAITARFQQEAGQEVFILDPFNVQRAINASHGLPTSGFNPLLTAKYLPQEEISDFAAMIAEMLVPESESHAAQDSFWTDSARNTIKTYILHLITERGISESDRHLGKLYEWFRLPQEEEIKLWVDMTYNPHTKFGGNEIKSMAVTAEKTWAGIQAQARKSTAFLESPLIQKSLMASEFDPMSIQTRGTTVYVILPERNLNTHKPWLRIVFGTMLKLCNFVAKRRVNFLMDEFPILGRMDDFLRAFAFGRGQKISCWVFAQSLSQLKQIYGEDGLNTFISNSRLRQFFGVNDLYTQTYVSDLLGTTTEITSTRNRGDSSGSSTNSNTSSTMLGPTSTGSGEQTTFGSSMGETEQIIQRKLMLPDEVGNLTSDFILFVDGDKYRVRKWPYYTPNVYPGRFDPNPYVHQ